MGCMEFDSRGRGKRVGCPFYRSRLPPYRPLSAEGRLPSLLKSALDGVAYTWTRPANRFPPSSAWVAGRRRISHGLSGGALLSQQGGSHHLASNCSVVGHYRRSAGQIGDRRQSAGQNTPRGRKPGPRHEPSPRNLTSCNTALSWSAWPLASTCQFNVRVLSMKEETPCQVPNPTPPAGAS